VELKTGNVYGGVTGPFDLIVSNPPYIPEGQQDGLQSEVRHFEPHTALFGGTDGLEIIERIVREAHPFLVGGGYLLMEIGFDQSERVRTFFDTPVWQSVEFLPDLQGIPRIVRAHLA
jgi:release factor glutamine methyltransferase